MTTCSVIRPFFAGLTALKVPISIEVIPFAGVDSTSVSLPLPHLPSPPYAVKAFLSCDLQAPYVTRKEFVRTSNKKLDATCLVVIKKAAFQKWSDQFI